jgi:hypothetical protein
MEAKILSLFTLNGPLDFQVPVVGNVHSLGRWVSGLAELLIPYSL